MISTEDQELLSAYIDGELTGAALTGMKERLLAEPELRRELDALTEADGLVVAFSKQIDAAPVPGHIQSLVRTKSSFGAVKLFAVAASVFVLTIGSFLFVSQSSQEADAQWAMLDELISGERVEAGDGFVEVIASFRQTNGGICREVMTATTQQVLCRQGGSWVSQLEVTRQAMPEGSFQPAGVGDIDVIDDYVSKHIDGSVLTTSEERALISQSWR